MNELEAEFKKIYDDHKDELNEAIKEASRALKVAEKLSRKYGLPFYSPVSRVSQSYTPQSFVDRFGQDADEPVDEEFVANLTDAWPNGYGGWTHSMVCS